MAEAFLRKYAGDAFEPHSAGLEPAGINPFTIKAMEEIGVDMSPHVSKGLSEYMGKTHFSYLITVCASAEEKCPSTFPGMGQRLHWPFEDPAAAEGTDDQNLSKFREIRDQIGDRVKGWLSEKEVEIKEE
jgi:arsenate reductase